MGGLTEHGLSRAVCSKDVIRDVRNFSLSLTGLNQVKKLQERFSREGVKFDRRYSSPVFYARQSSNGIFGLGNYSLDGRLNKLGHGDWERRTYGQAYTPEVMAELEGDLLNWKGHGGESQFDVGQRMLSFLESVRETIQEGNVGAVTHRIPIRSLIRVIMGLDVLESRDIEIMNTSMTQLRYENGIWKVVKINDYEHLL